MTPEEADLEINQRALPVFRDFRYREPSFPFYRVGSPYLFSEFTKHPSVSWWSPQMTGGRGSGHLTGQYGFGSPVEDAQPLPGPVNPFMITAGKKWSDVDPANDFATHSRNVLRLCEQLAGQHNWIDQLSSARILSTWDRNSRFAFPFNGMTYYVNLFWIIHSLRSHINEWDCMAAKTGELENALWMAILDWTDFQQVHPMNIFLSRCGFDGIMWGEFTSEWGDIFEWGSLKFPPITIRGEVVGLVPVNNSRFMVLPH